MINEAEIYNVFGVIVDEDFKNKVSLHYPIFYERHNIESFYKESINRVTDYRQFDKINEIFKEFQTIMFTLYDSDAEETHDILIKYLGVYDQNIKEFNTLLYNFVYKYDIYNFSMSNQVTEDGIRIVVKLKDRSINPFK